MLSVHCSDGLQTGFLWVGCASFTRGSAACKTKVSEMELKQKMFVLLVLTSMEDKSSYLPIK